MTAGQLSDVLGKVADLIDAAGGKAADGNQVRQLAERLRPFAPQTLAQFGDFLAIAAGHRDGDLRAYFPAAKPPTKPKAVKAPKPPKPSAAELVDAAACELNGLYDRGLEPDVTPERVDAALEPIGKLTGKQLDEVAAGCGFKVRYKTKKETLDALRKWVLGRRGTFERSEV